MKNCQTVVENQQNMDFANILKIIGLNETGARIYARLVEGGKATPRQLAEHLSISRPSVYDQLRLLTQYGLVVEAAGSAKKTFQAEGTNALMEFIQSKSDSLSLAKKHLQTLLPRLVKDVDKTEPQVKIYPGAEGVKRVLNDMLWYSNTETLTMWPISEMVEVLGKEYLENLNRRRIRQNISIRGIWPQNRAVSLKDHPFLGVGKGHLRELRFAPRDMTWDMSYWLYKDKVAFISSRREYLGFVVQSRDFASLIKANFEIVWKLSKPIKAQPRYTDAFLRTI